MTADRSEYVHPYIEAQKDRAPRPLIDGRLLAARLRRLADKYESNSTGMSDEVGAAYDNGWVAGVRHAADFIEADESDREVQPDGR